jgi:hypothetical protein
MLYKSEELDLGPNSVPVTAIWRSLLHVVGHE